MSAKNIDFGSMIGFGNLCVTYNIRASWHASLIDLENAFAGERNSETNLFTLQCEHKNKNCSKHNRNIVDALLRYSITEPKTTL